MRQHQSLALLTALVLSTSLCQAAPRHAAGKSAIDNDLLEVTIPQLQKLYATHKYTVTQVVQWHLARIAKYNGIYQAVETVFADEALAAAAAEDAAAKQGGRTFQRGPLWGVPMVIKANTSIQGHVTTDGWQGFTIPGHELIAPRNATVVTKLRGAGAIILGQTNMPDFAASDTNRSSSFGRTGNAYDVRFSPGGSSGGTVTAITANFAVVGTGTDTGNSIRMPSSTSAVIGVLPTRGLVSIAGIAPLDWLLDNTGPIARNVTDAAIALSVMTGEDPMDYRTAGIGSLAQSAPYTQYLKPDALKGKRFGVPAFIVREAPADAAALEESRKTVALSSSPPKGKAEFLFCSAASIRALCAPNRSSRNMRPETRALFNSAIEGLRAAGATVVIDDSILPDTFPELIRAIDTRPYRRNGTELFLSAYGPPQYHSIADYEKVAGSPMPATISGVSTEAGIVQVAYVGDAKAKDNIGEPRKKALAAYLEPFDRLHLDGLVYPAAQMPPPDETMPQDGRISSGPHSNTGWVNKIGTPAVVVVGGFYPNGLPFGLELATRPWKDGDLLGYAYAYEQATHRRKPPVLVEKGLLPRK